MPLVSQDQTKPGTCESLMSAEAPPTPDPKWTRPNKSSHLKNKHKKHLLTQVKQMEAPRKAQVAVAELFSPPRLTLQARSEGATGLAFDIKQGCDLNDKSTQAEVSQLLDEACPSLLTASPPCTHCGGWDHLNSCYRTPLERAKLLRVSRSQLKFCAQQIQRQLDRGGDFLLEHPVGSRIWKDPLVAPFVKKYGLHRVDMCAYGLKCPRNGLPIRKSTSLLCSNPALASGAKRCPGCPVHQRVEGQVAPGVNRSTFTAAYCPGFVKMLWDHLGPNPIETLVVSGEPLEWSALQCECLAGAADPPADRSGVAQEPSPDQPQEPQDQQANLDVEQAEEVRRIDRALKRLHANLGHPSSKELVRILKHSGASEKAISRVSSMECSVCANQTRPTAPLPANATVATEFNEKVGIDVKYLPGWKPTQRIPCVNIVDYATSLQVMVPLPRAETGELLCDALRDRWLAWAGPPASLYLDPSQPNQSETLQVFCNNLGIDMKFTAAEAHWQLGKVERHGQWFGRIMQRVLDDVRPSDEREWLECLMQAQAAKNSLLSEAGASPAQLVFGRNPRIPSDLMQANPHVPASDAAMQDSLLEKTTAIRLAARRAMLECQDDRALRAALRARPRTLRPFKSGDWVYYWRTQMYVGGVRIDGGRWYGAALVLGAVGRNFVVAHRRSLLRCAPEQMRFATATESTVAEFPESELLGIRNLLERGQFPKSQFIDVTQEGRPPVSPEETSSQSPAAGLNAAQCLQAARREEEAPVQPLVSGSLPEGSSAVPYPETRVDETSHDSPSYAPIRRAVRKTPPSMLLRPP